MVKVFDFFSGCGGTSSGFASAGMDIVFGLDIDRDSAATFQTNFPDAAFFLGDISRFDPNSLFGLIDSDDLTLFCGCAPCQPFSKQNSNKKARDPRAKMLDEFCRMVVTCLPDFVFVENVPGMQRIGNSRASPFSKFKAKLRKLGYFLDVKVVPALWYGVPQSRERLVLLASRHGEIRIPTASHGEGLLPVSTVADWISGLESLDAGQQSSLDPDHQAMALSSLNRERILSTPEGGGRGDWPAHLVLKCHEGHRGHSDVYGRLSWDRPAAAMTTRCISYSNGRFGHPSECRAISLREAACLQTFPRNYRFSGTLTSKARQVGNAVPPLMAQRIGETIVASARLGMND
ncbi:TPA: DNA cytosine methyltransferase [Stenotrophomonas maltophilia]|nr:DNA cytosine methyltransferase [Stenotrophomonas maltophilia]HDS1155577.1 DNA cytosine methyltransferase [Stenotrophomonas maltophilia]HDS1167096.1 DNA cytosine methyltransferase [Stenotrophomonas maltophilia]HDS1169083.1 DNA cytosine methyltransferase [Stenotrophomonas maltophilia]HDS1174457.1 DNA cytosine methyltransferase [Stenotrophomonas maltophilia]